MATLIRKPSLNLMMDLQLLTHNQKPILLLLLIIQLIDLTFSTLCRTSCGDTFPSNILLALKMVVEVHTIDTFYLVPTQKNLNSEPLLVDTKFTTLTTMDDPHILVTDPFMWRCEDGDNYRPTTTPFSLDTSTRFKLSPQNEHLFFNCSEDNVLIKPKPMFCEHCDSSCDSASYLCRHLPGCSLFPSSSFSCCSYYPKASESLRLMLEYCTSYTSVYWRNVGAPQPYDQVPQYGIRVDFDIPVTTRCLQCQDSFKDGGGGTCGFDTESQSFMCLCKEGNFTTHCKDYDNARHNRNVYVIAGTVTGILAFGVLGIGAAIFWYLKKVKAKAPVTCGVQTNDNRFF